MRLRLVLVLLAMFSVFLVPAARAQTDLETARADVAQATERLEDYLAELERVQLRGNEWTAEFWSAQSGVEALNNQVRLSEALSSELAAERSLLADDVRAVAVDRYVNRSLPIQWNDIQSPADRAAAEALADLMIRADQEVIDQMAKVDAEYERARKQLEDQRSLQQQRIAEAANSQAEVSAQLERMAELRGQLDDELVALEAALVDLEAAEQDRLAAAERERLAQERARAQAAAAAAALLRPAPVATPVATPVPVPTLAPTVVQTPIPNPTPSVPLGTSIPNPTPSVPLGTPIPNPTPSVPLGTPIPNPTPSVPLATPTPVPNVTGSGIVCPLNGPFTHIDDFNSPRAVGGIHRANDLISSTGTPVIAVASGKVEHRNSSVGGLSAHLRGDNGDYYFYTHLSGYENVGAGHVAAGTVIGYVGETGNAPIPHLHFEIHSGGYGNYINPYPLVRAACP